MLFLQALAMCFTGHELRGTDYPTILISYFGIFLGQLTMLRLVYLVLLSLPLKNLFHHVYQSSHVQPLGGTVTVKLFGRERWDFGTSVILITSVVACSAANRVYSSAIQDYNDKLCSQLRQSPGSKRWWSLSKSLIGCSSKNQPCAPSSTSLANHFSSKLSNSSIPSEKLPTLQECHSSLFCQFWIKHSRVKYVLMNLDVAKSTGDNGEGPRVLKSCAPSLCDPLTGLFWWIVHQRVFPVSWKIIRITPVYKKGPRSDPTKHHPIAVLPTLSCVFEHVLAPQLYKCIVQHIPSEQFGFVKDSNTLDAGVSLASSIASALNQRAEVRLVALDIKGAFDHVCWNGLLAHL